MSTFFTADLHVSHANVIKYVPRPFASVEEMDGALVSRWNEVVRQDDEVYIVGDFALCKPSRAFEIARSLNGRKFLVRGNHDKDLADKLVREKLFEWVKDIYTVKIADAEAPRRVRRIVLFHYAMRVWDRSHHGAYHLYGHSHGSLPEDPNSLSFDIGVDCWDYRPVSYAQVKAKMKTKQFVPVDHHHGDEDGR